MIKINMHLKSSGTLIMHADTLADPLHPRTKEFKRLSSKKTKTDDDYENMARLEFMAGLYRDDVTGEIVLPYPNIMKCLIEGARMSRSGPKIEKGVTIAGAMFPLIFEGPKDPEKLYADKRFVSRMTVKVGTSRTIRCRPQFPNWDCDVAAFIDPAIINLDEMQEISTAAGQFIGLGDYRKGGGFGRFSATVTQL